MKPIILNFGGILPANFAAGLQELAPLLGICPEPHGRTVTGFSAAGPELHIQDGAIRIGWRKPVHFWRMLSMVPEHIGDTALSYCEQPRFEVGFMIDASRNAVPSLGGMKRLLRRMALMGMDAAMLYTEDTYEVPGYPYFGYMRGRYTQAELRELDDYADLLGIELIPFIQTLAHLDRALHWPAMNRFRDIGEVLLCDDDATLEFIRAMLQAASAPFRSRRIHIGMDEADGIGLGVHLERRGYEPPHEILKRHLAKVRDLAVEMGLQPMMWADMFFSPNGGYYNSGDPTPEAIASVAPGVGMVYWDYYHEDHTFYAEMIRRHKMLGNQTYFAGGIWTWVGPAPDYRKTVAASTAGLAAAQEAGLPFCVACAWGDDGAEANMMAALAGIQLYAEYAYTGGYHEEWLASRFQACCDADLSRFFGLTRFNHPTGMRFAPNSAGNAAKFLLYQDPMLQLFAADTAGLALSAHYETLASEYAGYAAEGGPYVHLMEFYAQLGRVLAVKCRWYEEIRAAVRSGIREEGRLLAERLLKAADEVEVLRLIWRDLWSITNKPFGFEIIDGRLGALRARMQTASDRIYAWADGDPEETLPELLEEVLPFTKGQDGTLRGYCCVSEIVSAGRNW